MKKCLTFDQMTCLDNMCVRVIDSHIKAQRLQQNILIEDEILGFLVVLFFL